MSRLWSQPRSVVMAVVCCALWGCGNTGTDVVTDDGPGGAAQPAPTPTPEVGVARTRVRNESVARKVDVTVRYIRDEVVVHLAFVRVLPETDTTLLSSHLVDTVEVFGNDSDGIALENVSFRFGVDFDDQNPVEYVIFDDHVEVEPPVVPDDVTPVDVVPARPPTITVLEPAQAVSLELGLPLTVRWRDFADLPNAVVRLFLSSVSAGTVDELIAIGPAISAAQDGANDQYEFVLSNVVPGDYELIAEIDDGVTVVRSVAPGLVSILLPPVDENRPPFLTISIVGGPGTVVLGPDDLLEVTWVDSDPDDNATIVFSLEPSNPVDAGLGTFQISPPFAEDQDGPLADRALLPVRDVLFGLFDLVGTISDDNAPPSIARLPRAVRIQQPAQHINIPPTITLKEPFTDFDTWAGSSFEVGWDDEDPDNDARITLFLDPPPFSNERDGNEIVLLDSISEDGSRDGLRIGVSKHVPVGEYQLGAVISDGIAEQESRAAGIVIVVDPPDPLDDGEEPPTEGPPDGQLDINPVSPPYLSVESSRTLPLLIPLAGKWMEGIPERVTLSNVPHGGDTTVEFVPDEWSVERGDVIRVFMPIDLLSNRDWPRKFDAEVELSGGMSFTLPQDLPVVWVPQQVELLGVAAAGFACGDSGELLLEDTRFRGFEVSFFGGGLAEEAPGAQVEIWLSSNGVVPPEGVEDATHRLLWVGPGSPNASHTVRVGLDTAYFGRDELLTSADGASAAPPELEAGTYHIVAVADFTDYGRSIVPAYSTTVELCATDEPVRSIASPLAP